MNLDSIYDSGPVDNDTYTSRMRHQRDLLLAASDWAMTSDAPTDKTAWATYRQALRDFPATWTPAPTVDFPVVPS